MLSLREAVESGSMFAEGAISIIAPKSNAPAAVDNATFIFYLTAKEILLAGKSIQIVHMADLSSALSGVLVWGEAPDFFRMARDADVLMVDGLFSEREPYFSPQAANATVAYLMRVSREGKPIVFCGHGKQDTLTNWWPPSFVGYVQRKAAVFEVPQ
jgi:hypothetical protein